MKLIQILSLAALLLGVTASPVGEADVSVAGRPAMLQRDQIPADALVLGLSENPTASADGGSNLSRMSKRDDCHGSGFCGGIDEGACADASDTYHDDGWYCGYTSRVSNHCTAIFTCGNYHDTCWAGWFLKQS